MSETKLKSKIEKPSAITAEDRLFEERKRRREKITIFLISMFFVFLTWFEVRLFSISQELPFVHSIFFFGLVNFNIIILLLLLFLIFRNVVKVFVERREGIFGSSLKSKLVAAFVSFSVIPALLIMLTSVFYINSSFDKWFSVKISGVLKGSLEVTNAYTFSSKKRNYHFASLIAGQIYKLKTPDQIAKYIRESQKVYSLDAVEFYPSLFGKRVVATSEDESIAIVPPVTMDFLQKGIREQVHASVTHQFGAGNLVRVIVPLSEVAGDSQHAHRGGNLEGAVVVSSFIPLSLLSKSNDISVAYDELKDLNPIEYPLKSIYLIISIIITFVILFAAIWFGFYLAKQLSIPLVQLGYATQKVAEGEYTKLDATSGSEEITQLIDSFNLMSENLSQSRKEIHEYARYREVVLKNVSAGVISVDSHGKITTFNERAGELLKLNPEEYVGSSVRDLLTLEYMRNFTDILRSMKENKVESLRKEFQITVQGEPVPISLTLSLLKDDEGREMGQIIVFDDMTPILSAQRAQAWTEVARRIAHEIKNPLTPIKLSAERLQRKFGSQIQDPAFSDCTSMIIRQTEDLRSLVNEFNQFARLPEAKPIVGSLNKCVEEALVLFKTSHPQVKLDFHSDSQLPEFKFDPDQFRRVIHNLVDNAIQACSGSPDIHVTLTTQYDDDLKIVRLVVADNGPGIPQKDRARVFEPYFSTKESGTGLGLAIVRRIIEDHSGFIRAAANEPRGAKMIIELPVHKVAAF